MEWRRNGYSTTPVPQHSNSPPLHLLMNPYDTRSTLIGRLKNWRDNQSWEAFFDAYWRLIYSVALKAGCTEQEAQDVVQETVVSVAREMPTFEYDRSKGSFKSWLLRITCRRIAD